MWRLGWSTKGTVETKTQTTLVEPHILLRWANPSLTLAIDSLTIPV